MHRKILEHIRETTFMLEGSHEALRFEEGQDTRRNTTSQIDTTCRKYFECQVASLSSQDRGEGFECGDTARRWNLAIKCVLDDNRRRVLYFSELLSQMWCLFQQDVVPEIRIDMRESHTGTDLLVAHMIETCQHIAQQFHLKEVGRCKVGMTTFCRMRLITCAVP